MAPRRHTQIAAAAAAALLAVGQVRAIDLTLTGFCDAKSDLEGLTFRSQGRTKSGAPWYKSIDHIGPPAYIYWDPDCPGSSDGTPRWIIDSDKPNVTADRDLDNDGACQYHARINSKDTRAPPQAGMWSMDCHDGWRTKFLIIIEKTTSTTEAPTKRTTSTKPPPTTTKPPKTRRTTSTQAPTKPPKTTTTVKTTSTQKTTAPPPPKKTTTVPCPKAKPAPPPKIAPEPKKAPPPAPKPRTTEAPEEEERPVAPKMVYLTGACELKHQLNGLTFVLAGYTAAGSPFYKAHEEEEYLYHDRMCAGPKGRTKPRWILDSDKPQQFREYDLDGDSKCDYHARLDSKDMFLPPVSATWRMFCGDKGWTDAVISLHPVDKIQPTEVPKDSTSIMFVSAAARPAGMKSALLATSLAALLALLVPR